MGDLSNEIIFCVSYIIFLSLSLFPNSWRLAALKVSCSIIGSGFAEPYQVVSEQFNLAISTMTETRSTAAMNEAIASLRTTSDHHTKEIQEIHQTLNVHTCNLNEMNQQLALVLQKLSSNEDNRPCSPQAHTPKPSYAIVCASRLSPHEIGISRVLGREPYS